MSDTSSAARTGYIDPMEMVLGDAEARLAAVKASYERESAALRARVTELEFPAKMYANECDLMQAFVREHGVGGVEGYGRSVFDLMREEVVTLRARVTRLREALEKYADHREGCPYYENGDDPPTCTCGLSRALEDDRE